MASSLSIVFAGTPEFSVPALEALLGSTHRVAAVYTQPDRPAGRGQHVAMSAVKQCALQHGLAIEQPLTLRDSAAVEKLASWRPDVMVVVAYGLILPPDVLAIPRLGCVNIHASLLPRWRGAAPIQRAILAGDKQSGVTIMRMDAGLDTGPMLLERTVPIADRETAATLHDRLAAEGAGALLQGLAGLADGSIVPRAQPEHGVTYAAKIRKQEAIIDWSRSAPEIDRQIRAFNPWPIAETRWNGQQLRVWEAVLEEEDRGSGLGARAGKEPDGNPSSCPEPQAPRPEPGSIIAADATGIRVATGGGALRLTRVQLAGRKAVTASEFLNAHRIAGALLGE